MDRDQWTIILAAIKKAARKRGRAKRCRYSDWLIVAMYLWSVGHDRPLCWACQRSHYGALFRPRVLPSVSQFTRRIKTERCQRLLQMAHDALAGRSCPTALSYFDGKPLVVGSSTRDVQAKSGHICGGYAKGYKLHVWVTEDRRIPVWSVQSLNMHEVKATREMISYLPPLSSRSLILADKNYDAAKLHHDVASCGGRLLTPPCGIAKRPKTLRAMPPSRR